MTSEAIVSNPGTGRLARLMPGLAALLGYRRADLPRDLIAGLSVAAVALPVGVAYAQLAGFSPVVGLYASILPLIAYALFGTSRQLIVGPEELSGFHSIVRHPEARTDPGLVLLRFNAPLVFFNAPYFKQRALAAIAAAGPDLRWLVLDALPLTQVDVTGYDTLHALSRLLHERGAELVMAGRLTETQEWMDARGFGERRLADRHFPTLRRAVLAYRALADDSAIPESAKVADRPIVNQTHPS